MTLAEAFAEYETYAARSGKPASVRQVHHHARGILSVLDGRREAASIAPVDVERVTAWLLGRGLRNASANAALAVLRMVLRRAGMLAGFTAPRVGLLKVPRNLPRVWTPSQIERIRAFTPDPRVRLAILLAAHAGLRHGEILHLTEHDVNLEERRVKVTAKAWLGGNWSPKSHAERVIPLTIRLCEELAAHLRDVQYGTRLQAWLFPGKTPGQPLRSLHEPVQAAIRAASLYVPGMREGLHQLRRTWASELLGRGVDLETVRELGGWRDLATVQRYLASTDGRKRDAIGRLEA